MYFKYLNYRFIAQLLISPHNSIEGIGRPHVGIIPRLPLVSAVDRLLRAGGRYPSGIGARVPGYGQCHGLLGARHPRNSTALVSLESGTSLAIDRASRAFQPPNQSLPRIEQFALDRFE